MLIRLPAYDDRETYHHHQEHQEAGRDDDDGDVGLGEESGHGTRDLDVTLLTETGEVPGLAGELALHSLGDLKLCGGVENCRCKA